MAVDAGRVPTAALIPARALPAPTPRGAARARGSGVGVLEPEAVLVPNSKCTRAGAPAGLRLPFMVAEPAPTPVAASVVTPSGREASENSRCGSPAAVCMKNGGPMALPWQAAPSALNGFAVQVEETGTRCSTR